MLQEARRNWVAANAEKLLLLGFETLGTES